MHRKLRQLDLKDDGLGASKNIGMPLPLKWPYFPVWEDAEFQPANTGHAKVTRQTAMNIRQQVSTLLKSPTIAEISGRIAEVPNPVHAGAGVTFAIEVDGTAIGQHEKCSLNGRVK